MSPLLLDSSRGAILQELSPFLSLPPSLSSFFSSLLLIVHSPPSGCLLPQTVHDMAHASAFHNLSTYLGAWMGSITATGSVGAITLHNFCFISIRPFLLNLFIKTSFNCPNHRLGYRIRQAVWSIIFKRSSAGLQRSHQHGTRSSQCTGPSE